MNAENGMNKPDRHEPSLSRREFVQAAVLSSTAALFADAAENPRTGSFTAGSEWPMYRHDPALTGVSPLKGGLGEAPRVAWTVDLGGPKVPGESVVVRDVTGDGRDDFLTLSSDTVVCRDNRGRILWKLDNFLNPVLLAVEDFAGDGSRGLLFTTTRAGKVDTYMVGGRTGKATHLWLDENNFGGHTRIGKLLPDVPGMQIAATASGQTPPGPHGGDVRLVSFERGLVQPHFRVRQHVTGVFYSPIFLFADLDGDGQDELVVIGHEQIWGFDPYGGSQKFYAAYGPSIRNYLATVAAVKLQPGDARPALVMINPSLPGLKAVAQDGKSSAHELWKVVIGGKEDQYQKLVTVGPAGTSLVYDLNRDGRNVVLVSIKNEHGDGESRLVIFEASTGRRLGEFPDVQVLEADDLDGDGKLELLLLRGSELSISRWEADELKTVWQQANVLPLLRP